MPAMRVSATWPRLPTSAWVTPAERTRPSCRRLLELRVAYHAGQDRHGRRARGQEGLQPLRVLCEDRQRRVYIARRERRELGRELFGVHDLEYGGEVVCSGFPPTGMGSRPVRIAGGSALLAVRLCMSSRRACCRRPSGSIRPRPSITFTRSQA